ncbi:1,4-beta-N-acetylmuramidase [Vineibacter terrae]|uniref:1,4-beta-N-acetylmuramidase n=2 Tax=Vineibacter terrae TaxID=2586908 RepID=A0A5C8PIJ0_9HYPH|nr:1,4-beta-N-acetylmuramidase [Vineibacter terrae]
MTRRAMLGGMGCGLAMPGLAGCGARQAAYRRPDSAQAPARPAPSGLDAVIDISHMVDVSDFGLARRHSDIEAVIHKSSEGGDWFDPSYGARRAQAEAAGMLWGAYHYGTRQYSGADQAAAFLSAAQPGPSTLLALDFELNDRNPRNTMTLAQAETFVLAVQQATGRLPMVYVHPNWANGVPPPGHSASLAQPIMPGSILARCELWLADYRDEPEVPMAWADRGWRLWQYVANESPADAAYGTVPRAVQGISHCDRNLFAGSSSDLNRFWRSGRMA